MKTIIWLAGLLLCGSLFSAGELVAHWDFTAGKISSVDGKFQTRFRGVTEIDGKEPGKQFLNIGMSRGDKPEGIITVEKYPELSPSEGMRLEIKFQLRERTGVNDSMCLWDNKYFTTRDKQGNPLFHSGFMLQLYENKEEKLIPVAWLGHGDRSSLVYGTATTLSFDTPHTIVMEYDGKNKLQFEIDGVINKDVKLETGGPIRTACYPTVIGDRNDSTFCHFDGTIFDVKLFKHTPQK